ncbi:MAG: tetratricopeptide repeat protein [Acidobacteria bacterium]|nr:tetratricopeptide repeat protein [Acidobacteriota bacterium]
MSPLPGRPVVIGGGLRPLLRVVYALVAGLTASAIYLGAVTAADWLMGGSHQGYVYQWALVAHLGLGVLVLAPFVLFAVAHARAARRHPNQRAARIGYLVAALATIVLATGLALLRVAGIELRQPAMRGLAYWLHVLVPVAAFWAFHRHRRRGRPIAPAAAWTWGLATAAVVALTAVVDLGISREEGTPGEQASFLPSLARTATGRTIRADALMNDSYCAECHQDAHTGWLSSAHRFSSFNNAVYAASVKETRQVVLARDGTVDASRWCAGCHDPVPLFSGAFSRPDFDTERDPTAQAGITCIACHAIEKVNSTRGNGDYTIGEPRHYPFALSASPALRALSQQLIKAKPAFHQATFLKPLHRTAEFCSTCHKVHIPGALNQYKDFLRGQNHYDSFILSGASGRGARSFYYPPQAQDRCAGCHMPLTTSRDFGAQPFDASGALQIHDHRFAGGNTGLPHLRGDTATVAAQQAFLHEAATLDLFGVREGGTIAGQLLGPLDGAAPALTPGQRYLTELVVRTRKVGHHFTQGTADSNEVWVQVTVKAGETVIGQSGALMADGRVDPWAHFTNIYMLDRQGRRIDRRNVQDIYVPLYDKQIPPGAAQVVHYGFDLPRGVSGPITIEARLLYRKFDLTLMRFVKGDAYVIDLPITTIATASTRLPGAAGPAPTQPAWERWNDYGIGLLLEGNAGSDKGELRQAEAAFAEVEKLGRPEGPLNLARVYYKEGRLDEAAEALRRAVAAGAAPWTAAWMNGLVNKENGHLDEAIANFTAALGATSPDLIARGFDFSRDYEVLNELGLTLFERAKQERGEQRAASRRALLDLAVATFERTLTLDSENVTAHYALGLIHADLGHDALAAMHRDAHLRYTADEQSRSRVIAVHRASSPAANHAAQSVVIYDLQRKDAPAVPVP